MPRRKQAAFRLNGAGGCRACFCAVRCMSLRRRRVRYEDYPPPRGAGQVALMFLTRGEMPLESVWLEFFTAAAAIEPRASPRSSEADAGGRWDVAAASTSGERPPRGWLKLCTRQAAFLTSSGKACDCRMCRSEMAQNGRCVVTSRLLKGSPWVGVCCTSAPPSEQWPEPPQGSAADGGAAAVVGRRRHRGAGPVFCVPAPGARIAIAAQLHLRRP